MAEDLTSVEASGSFAAEPRAVSATRHMLAQVLDDAGVGGERRADALLVASELVANAIQHGSGSDDRIDVEVAVASRTLRICVRDRARRRVAPTTRVPHEHAQSGRGLQIVEALAEWSERTVAGHREVTAELTL
ncbi:MAG TPA: ATP-binding protein [Gaiellaceae bacterium]|nr:ATP-binding protein [Gaiellaceae bacterium]